MIFIDNKYTTWYNNIIAKAMDRNLVGYCENHHIIPQSLRGNNKKENLVRLTAKEHFVCHLLLTKMVVDTYKEKMIYAAWMMANQENQNQQRYKITGRIYQSLKQEFSKIKSVHTKANNPMHDPKIRKRHQEAIVRRGKTSGNTGHKRGPVSNEFKELLRQKTIDSMTSGRRETIRQQQLNRTPEQKEKYAIAHSKRMSCVHCRQLCNPGTLSRFHGNNCKSK